MVFGGSPAKVRTIDTAPAAFFVTTGDVNLNGHPDIVAVHRNGNYNNSENEAIPLFMGNGSGEFNISRGFPTSLDGAPSAVAVGNIDDHPLPEIVTSNYRNNNITVLSCDPHTDIWSTENFPAGNRPAGIAIADLDGDRVGDVAVTINESNRLRIFYFSKTGSP
jgi:hypothetical protein